MAPGGSPPSAGSRSAGTVGPQTPPPAHTVDPRSAEFNAVWNDIRGGMDSVYRNEPMPKLRFVQLYSRLFNYCVSDYNAGNVAAVNPTLKPGTKRRRDVTNNVMKNDGRSKIKLYGNIAKHIKEHVAAVFQKGNEKMGETLLELYAAEWTQFQNATLVIDRMCDYLNRNCQSRGLLGPDDPTRYPPRDIRTMSLICWRNELLRTIRDPLVNATVRLIRRERRGEPINTGLVQTTVESFIHIGMDYTEEEEEEKEDGQTGNQATPDAGGATSLVFYKSVFEDVFLQDTEEFYAQESSEFLRQNPPSQYLKKAELRLEEEQNRVRRYLHESTLAALTAVCRRVLVEKHVDIVVSVVHELLVDEKRDDLGRLYQLVLHIPGCVAVLLELFTRQVELEGDESIQKNCQPVPPDPAAYVEALLQVHKKYQSIVLTSFGNDVSFARAMDKAFHKFVNINVVTQSTNGIGTAGARAAELLARYCDHVMKKKTTNDNDLEDTLDRLIVLFKYIDDKDAFHKFYHKTLGARLVHHLSTSDEAEANMVSKLRQTCGYEYTTKLQKMLTDVAVSRELNDKYRHGLPLRPADGTPAPPPSSFLTAARTIFSRSTPAAPSSPPPPSADVVTPKVDFNMMIMTSNSWPLFAGSTPINVPVELEKCYHNFVRYYNEQYTGRRLQWLFNLSKAEVATNCFAQRYTFTMSTLQLAVLLMYNGADNFTIMQLYEHTGMDMNILQQVVQVMLKSQLLVRSSTDDNAVQSAATDGGDVTLSEILPPETVIGLGLNYSSKRLRVNINLPLKAIVRKEQEDTHRVIEADRKLVIQAAIVRVMKMRQTIKHQQLMSEVLAILSRRFKAQIPVVKACIDILIEKEYMKREDDAPDSYCYIA